MMKHKSKNRSGAGYAARVLFFMLIGILCGSRLAARRAQEQPKFGGTLRVKDFSSRFINAFDPASDQNLFVLEQLYDGLVHLERNMTVVPALAEYWRISEDGKRYTFQLRKGVMFHHGREMTAEDVKFSLERLIDPKTPGAFYQYFINRIVGSQEFREGKAPDVAGFKVKDKYTFEMDLVSPYVSGLYLLSMYFCKVLPKDLVLEQGRRFFQRPSGTGPFKYAGTIRSPRLDIVGVRLERNPDYYGGKPYLDAVEYSPYYTLDHFLDKEIDIIPFLSERLSSTDCRVLEHYSLDLVFLGMSCRFAPFDDKTVRKALAMGIDKRKVAKAAFQLEYNPMVLDNFIPPWLPGFYPTDSPTGYDLEQARRLLAESGYNEEKKLPPLTLYVARPRTETLMKIFHELRTQLGLLGIDLSVKFLRSEAELKAVQEPHLVLAERLMDFPDPENIILPLFGSGAEANRIYVDYSQPQLDRLLEETETEKSLTHRTQLFRQIERILFEDVPAVPLYSNRQRIAYQPDVKGMETPALGFNFLDAKQIWLDRRE